MEVVNLKLLCSGCGASLEYSAGMQALKCVYCGTVTEIPRNEDNEADRADGLPDRVVTLTVTRNQLEDAVFQHLAEGKYTPDNLLEHATFTKVEQFFVPAYAFSGTYEAQWTASFGYDRTEHYTDFVRDSNGRSQPVSRTRTVTDWRPVNGTDMGQFSVITYGGTRLEESPLNLATRLVERCRLASDVVAYNESFTSGFEVEAYGVPSKEAYAARGEALVNRVIKAGVLGHAQGDHQKDWHWKATTRKQSSRVLIPVCHVVYEFEGTAYNVWVDGTSTGNLVADASPEDASRRKTVRNGFLPAILAGVGACVTFASAHESVGALPEMPLLWIGLGGALLYGLLRRQAILSYSQRLRNAILAQRKLDTTNTAQTSEAEQLKLIDACKRPNRSWLSGAIRDAVALPLVSAIALAAVLVPRIHEAIREPATLQYAAQATPAPTPSAAQTPPAAPAVQSSSGFSWLIGKHPSDVVNDPRFRAAFSGAPAQDWQKIADRLAVADANGIQLQNGFYVGSGCMAHACDSDDAAFAIDAANGRGDVIYRETSDDPDGKTSVRGYAWRDVPVSSTPLLAWATSKGINLSAPATSSQESQPVTTYQTSFDCGRARSDSERLVCGNAELAAADVELADLYARAKAAAPDQAAFGQHVRQQWNEREQNCHDKGCVAQWYADQKSWFNSVLSGQQPADAAAQQAPVRARTYLTSFVCGRATHSDEKAICGDQGLAAMDIQMSEVFGAAMQRTTNPDRLRAMQNTWRAQRQGCGSNLDCLRQAYGTRIAQLQQQP